MTASTTTAGAVVESRRSQGIWRDAFGRLIKNRLAIVGLLWVIFLALLPSWGRASRRGRTTTRTLRR